MAGPPVARIRLISGACMSACDTGIDGDSTQEMIFGGAPAATAASCTICAAAMVALAARGWGHSTSALRVLSVRRALKIAVEVGLVVGTMPTGSR